MKAARALAMMQERAQESSARAVGLALLAADFAARINAAKQEFGGDDLAARLSALLAEQRAAEKALTARLAGEAKERRSGIAKAYRAQRHEDRVKAGFRPAAGEVTDEPAKPPRRPAAAISREDPADDVRPQIPLPDPHQLD